MNRDLKFCAWLAPVGMVLLFLGMMPAAHFIPPPSPALGAEAISAFYAANSVGIRLAAMLIVTGATCFAVFCVPISFAMLRMEPRSQPLAAIQLCSGILAILPILLGGMIFAAAAFRPERAVGLVQLLNDLGWIFFIMPAPTVLPQLLVIGIAILRDRSARPVFPRWFAYVNFWVALLFQPGVLAPLFKTGPFAWDGLLAFWVPFGVFGAWLCAMWWMLIRIPSVPALESDQ